MNISIWIDPATSQPPEPELLRVLVVVNVRPVLYPSLKRKKYDDTTQAASEGCYWAMNDLKRTITVESVLTARVFAFTMEENLPAVIGSRCIWEISD